MSHPKQGKVFRGFGGYIMNVEVDYENKLEMKNTSDSIAGVLSEEYN